MYMTGYTFLSTGYDRIYCLINVASCICILQDILSYQQDMTGYTVLWMRHLLHISIFRDFLWFDMLQGLLDSKAYTTLLVRSCFESIAAECCIIRTCEWDLMYTYAYCEALFFNGYREKSFAIQYFILLHTYECNVMYMYAYLKGFFSLGNRGLFQRV